MNAEGHRYMLKTIWFHVRDIGWHVGMLFNALGAWAFGKVTHDGYAITFRGISYRIKNHKL